MMTSEQFDRYLAQERSHERFMWHNRIMYRRAALQKELWDITTGKKPGKERESEIRARIEELNLLLEQ